VTRSSRESTSNTCEHVLLNLALVHCHYARVRFQGSGSGGRVECGIMRGQGLGVRAQVASLGVQSRGSRIEGRAMSDQRSSVRQRLPVKG
jgi:hypothetical protein